MYLIDTNIVSITAPARGRATALVQWLEGKTSLLFLSVIIGRPTSFADIAIAATAKQHGLVVLTRNLKHFAPLGVQAHDPLASLPA